MNDKNKEIIETIFKVLDDENMHFSNDVYLMKISNNEHSFEVSVWGVFMTEKQTTEFKIDFKDGIYKNRRYRINIFDDFYDDFYKKFKEKTRPHFKK